MHVCSVHVHWQDSNILFLPLFNLYFFATVHLKLSFPGLPLDSSVGMLALLFHSQIHFPHILSCRPSLRLLLLCSAQATPPLPPIPPSPSFSRRFLQIGKGEDKSALIPTVNHCAKRSGPPCSAPEGGRVIWAGTVHQNLPHTTGSGLRGERVPANVERKTSPYGDCF